MKRLVLIDGHSILYRAYHALPKLTTKSGAPANAVYGFVSMLLKIIQEQRPDYVVVAFDRPGPTFRNELFAQYQAHRPKPDEDFIVQIGTVHELLADMGVAVYDADGYEADDVIGTLARRATDKSKVEQIAVIIATSDRDQLQLVGDQVRLLMPANALGKTKLYGEKETVERIGVAPHYIADLKGLAGDPSDNIPGISGIGPKTAAALINQFGSLEDIYKQLDAVEKKSVREKLEHGRDMAFLSKKLATIVVDAPVSFDLAKSTTPDLVRPDVVEKLNELGFTSLVKRLSGKAASRGKKQPHQQHGSAKHSKNSKQPPRQQMELL